MKTMKNIKKFEHFNLPEETNVYSETHESQNYMFFANLQNIQRYIDAIKELPQEEVDDMLSEHDWASDHVSVACENLEHVHNFLVNSFSDHISLPKTENNDEDDNL